ncbi:unnamed protein product [Zymoseptoria tritici ST99CH_3D7]|uniref:Uncharacterized protein n=1 Tax=Zymoseptoria tritici (strain ST99CH_3D7) TaxID=1276538 RepID=A0A1X7RL34_ZYMT9|nr:unnamed protein product [Zymoseptoria tritici ST99CH_3D7]
MKGSRSLVVPLSSSSFRVCGPLESVIRSECNLQCCTQSRLLGLSITASDVWHQKSHDCPDRAAASLAYEERNRLKERLLGRRFARLAAHVALLECLGAVTSKTRLLAL